MDAKTDELRAAHDVLAEFYADRLAGALDRMPAERAVLGLFCDLTLAAGLATTVGDIGCGTGRLAPCLAAGGLSPQGIDLSPGMIRSRPAKSIQSASSLASLCAPGAADEWVLNHA